jgi:FG-GAP-like repeat/NHL repeat
MLKVNRSWRVLFLLACLAWTAPSEAAGPYRFRTLAGLGGSSGSTDGTGSAARFNTPYGVAVDGAGTIYVSDTFNHTIRAITPAGATSTLAGLAGSAGSTDGTGSAARFNTPTGIAIDAAGNLYVADSHNHTIRKISPAGAVSTMAGLAGSVGSADGTGSAARFRNPLGVAVDSAGTLYVGDTFNGTIRKITPSGTVSTLAGLAGSTGSADGFAGEARFYLPAGLTVDAAGNIYIADSGNYAIRKFDPHASPTGTVSTLAGGGYGSADGTGSAARFNFPASVAADGGGTLYVADQNNHTIRKITPAGVVSTLAGLALVPGSEDATGNAARFQYPRGVAVDAAGRVLIADSANHSVRAMTAAGAVTTVAGLAPGYHGSADGSSTMARFWTPIGVAVNTAATVYVADFNNHTIRSITPAGTVSTLAGLAGSYGYSEGPGSAARFWAPTGVAVDTAGTLYVADSGNCAIRKITPAGVVSTLVVLDSSTSPRHIAVAADGMIYVAAVISDSPPHDELLKITPAGSVSTLATGSGAAFTIDGVAVNAAGTVYFTDARASTVQTVSPSGTVTILAGSSFGFGNTDGIGSAAQFWSPAGITLDATGNAYVTDTGNSTIRKITPAAVVTTLGGLPRQVGTSDGVGSAARFNQPRGIAADAGGRLYIADTDNNSIRLGATGRAFDYDGDGRAELMVYRPGNGSWYKSTSSSSFTGGTATQFGLSGDVPVPGDYDGDNTNDLAVCRPSTGVWFILQSATATMITVALPGSASGDVPVPGDFDGDGKTDPAVYRPSIGVWTVIASTTGQPFRIALGRGTDIPVPGDYDGDGRTDAAVYRPSTGIWLIRFSSTANNTSLAIQWGLSADVPVPADYDGDGKTDLAVYRPATGVWYILTSSSGYASSLAIQWGLTGDTPVPADYDGDTRADLAVYRPAIGTWFILQSSTAYTTSVEYSWGLNGDIPIPNVIVANGKVVVGANQPISPLTNLSRMGDFDGDGRGDITVYRPSAGTWLSLKSSTNYSTSSTYASSGSNTDLPVAGDFDGDGKTDLVIYRPSTGVWTSLQSSTGFTQSLVLTWGASGDIPVPSDYDGDSKTDFAVYRPSTGDWFIRWSNTNYATSVAISFGLSGDIPIPGDYDGDGLSDLAVYRPSTGTWFILTSSSGFTSSVSYAWGLNGDVPVAGDYDGDGQSDLAVYRPSSGGWFIRTSSTGYASSMTWSWGLSGDVPVAADYDGDGTTDLAVYRPATSEWYILKSSTGYASYVAFAWGLSGDTPIFKRE